MVSNFQGTVFLNYFGDTDVNVENYTPGRFLMTTNGPKRKKPKTAKSKTEQKTLPRIGSKANVKPAFDGFKEIPPEKIERENFEAVGLQSPGKGQTISENEPAKSEAVVHVTAVCFKQR